MQVVGQSCARCNERIQMALDVVACPTCHTAMHTRCGSDCASCGARCVDPRAVITREVAAENAAIRATLQRGERLYLAVCALSALMMMSGFVAFSLEGRVAPMGLAVRTFLHIALLAAMWQGRQWARVVLGLSASAGAVFSAYAMTSLPGISETAAGVTLFGVYSAICIALAAILLLARPLSEFIAYRREPTLSPA